MEPLDSKIQPETQTPNSNKHFGRTLAWGGGVLVLVVGFFFLGLYGTDIINYFKNKEKATVNNSPKITFSNEPGEIKDINPNIPTSTVPSENQNPDEIWISVEWVKDSIKIKCPKTIYDQNECYQAGTITSGEFEGQKLVLELVQELGTSFVYHAINGVSDTILHSYPQYPDKKVYKFRGIDDAPETIDFAGTKYKLKKAYRSEMFSKVPIKFKLFDDKVLGSVYLAENGCIIVKLPDHTALAYNLEIPFVNSANGELDLTFLSGEKNKDTYQYNAITGCGAMCYYLSVKDENSLKPQERLVLVGNAPSGEQFFAFSDTDSKELKDLYNDKNTAAYYTTDGSFQDVGRNKYTYEQFLSFHPLLYWKDPLGRWIEFKNQKFIPMAEMCKPVIYLYPETETNLEVKVSPNGGFTYTNPPYGAGWEVSATPEGNITDLKTGKIYNYLFWEGVGLNYPVNKTGWVIQKENLETFFNETLPELGLKGREVEDFKEYWLGRLVEHSYYKLNFLSQDQFNEIAPLEISGAKPKTVVRVLMTAKGLNSPEVSVPEELPELKARHGFTVIEWGGVVLK